MPFEYVTSQVVLTDEVIPELAKLDKIGLDIETRGFNPRHSDILTAQFGNSDVQWVVDARRVNLQPLLDMLTTARPLLIGHNLKYDLEFLANAYGFSPKRLFDTMLAYGIIYNGIESPYVSLKFLVEHYCGTTLDKDVRESFVSTYGDLTEDQVRYAARDVEYLIPIAEAQSDELHRDRLLATAQLEFRVIPVVVQLENSGIKLNQDKWLDVAEKVAKRAVEVEGDIARIIGATKLQESFFGDVLYDMNPRSNPQMLNAFHMLGVNVPDTKESTLSKIEHPLARTLLSYRKLRKMSGTYGKNFFKFIEGGGRLHAEFNQLGARSGRFTSGKPNMQNIPGDTDHRSCFICEPGNILVTADFSQIELKLAAILSNEPEMLAEYEKADADLHALTGCKIFGVTLDNLLPWQRQIGKHCNFGILYKISKYGMYKKWGIPLTAGERYIAEFKRAYPVLTRFMDGQSDIAVSQGYNVTGLGRRRYYSIPPLTSELYFKLISSVRRESSNFPIQGGAADIMKLSLINICDRIPEVGGFMVNTIHDEVVVEVPKQNVSEAVAIIYNSMSDAGEELAGDRLEWKVSVATGNCWKKT